MNTPAAVDDDHDAVDHDHDGNDSGNDGGIHNAVLEEFQDEEFADSGRATVRGAYSSLSSREKQALEPWGGTVKQEEVAERCFSSLLKENFVSEPPMAGDATRSYVDKVLPELSQLAGVAVG